MIRRGLRSKTVACLAMATFMALTMPQTAVAARAGIPLYARCYNFSNYRVWIQVIGNPGSVEAQSNRDFSGLVADSHNRRTTILVTATYGSFKTQRYVTCYPSSEITGNYGSMYTTFQVVKSGAGTIRIEDIG